MDTFDITAYGDIDVDGKDLSADAIPEIVINKEKSTIDAKITTGNAIKNPLPAGANARRIQVNFTVPTEEKVIVFECGGSEPLEVRIQPDNTTGNGSSATNPSTPGTVTPDTPSTDNNTPSTDNNTPSTDNNTPSTDNNNTSDDNNDDTKKKTTKKKAKVASVTAKKGKKIISGVVKLSSGKKVSKATVKVYVNNKKKATVKTKSSGKFSVKLSKKLKKGDKVKLVITKSNIKKITKTVKIK